MDRLQSVAERVSRCGAIVGGALLMLAAIIIGIDIAIRWAFARTIGGADELSGYALAIAGAWGFSSALLSRSHIRIDTLYFRAGLRLRALLDVLSLASLTFFMALIAWHGWGVLQQSYLSGSRSLTVLETPLVVPQALWLAGLVFFLAVAILLLARSLAAYRAGDLRAFFALIGSKAAATEVEEEIRAAELALEQDEGTR